jgi:uncharacterized protein (TIGR03437 family)
MPDDRAIAQDCESGTLISPQSPAVPGKCVTLYLTGQGAVDRPVGNGEPAPSDPLALPLAAVQAAFGETAATIAFAGLTPGLVGVMQLNLVVPELPDGDQDLSVTIGGVVANRAVLPVLHSPALR